jgi:tRNA threonylcarbamoyladenosine biosynthesis protein TsaB
MTDNSSPMARAMLTLAFDTATSVATSALVRDGELVAERSSRAARVLADADELLAAAGAQPRDLNAIVAGTGPGSFTGVRIGLAAARALAFALELPLAGVSTLAALAAGAPGAVPVVDAGRREVFGLVDGAPVVAAAQDLLFEQGATCVGDGAVRYREVLEARGAIVPPRESELHLPRARFHVELAQEFTAPDAVEPLYLRVPDAEKAS